MFKSIQLIVASTVLAGGLAVSASAQDLCGGMAANGKWIGGTEAASDVATAPAALDQLALVLGGNQFVSLFTVSTPSDVRVEAAARGTGDTLIDLYDAAGNLVLSDDDSGGDGASRSETMLGAGTYCLAMRSFDGAPMTGTVRVGLTSHEPLTTGSNSTTPTDDSHDMTAMAGGVCDASTDAARINDGAAIDDELATGITASGSVDVTPYWRFTLSNAQAFTVTAQNETADPVITIYDANGGWVADNDDSDGLNSRIDFTYPMQPGDYCIAVQALNDTSLPIQITISAFDAAAALRDSYDRGEAAPPLDGSHPITDMGLLASRLRVDGLIGDKAAWYSVDVDQTGLLLVEAIDPTGNGDPYLVLFDDLGRQIAYNDDNGQTYDSMVVGRVSPGTYLIAVGQLDGYAPSMLRILTELYLPAR